LFLSLAEPAIWATLLEIAVAALSKPDRLCGGDCFASGCPGSPIGDGAKGVAPVRDDGEEGEAPQGTDGVPATMIAIAGPTNAPAATTPNRKALLAPSIAVSDVT
jgi:hypothetical protein